MNNLATLTDINGETFNTLAKQGLTTKQNAIDWCCLANNNHVSIEWSVKEEYNIREGIKFVWYSVNGKAKRLNDNY